jgi:paraquat-inducible protein B
MVKRPSSVAIGMFVVGSIILAVAALAVLGSGSLFSKQHRFICFFSADLNGLKIGAPVKVRGVEIGAVKEIRLRLQPNEGQFNAGSSGFNELPVIIEIDESQLKAGGGTGQALKPRELSALIERGLRAQLGTESLLTGLLYIDIELHPGTPVKLMLVPGTSIYPEIPTVPTSLEQVQDAAMKALAKLDKVDFVRLTESISDAAIAASNLLNSPDIRTTLASLQSTTTNLQTAVSSIRELTQNLNHNSTPLLISLRKTSDQANRAMVQVTSAAAELQSTFAPDAPLSYRLNVALQNFSEASSSLRELSDYLQRNPSAVVRGRYVSESRQ